MTYQLITITLVTDLMELREGTPLFVCMLSILTILTIKRAAFNGGDLVDKLGNSYNQ